MLKSQENICLREKSKFEKSGYKGVENWKKTELDKNSKNGKKRKEI